MTLPGFILEGGYAKTKLMLTPEVEFNSADVAEKLRQNKL